MDRLGSMSTLVAVAEAGSLSAAARQLGTPLTTVSRKIAELERHLGTQLLNRSSRKIILTDAGKSYVATCKRILTDIVEAERIAKGEYADPKGEISITAPIVLGRLHLLPVLAEFLQAHPAISARLTLADRLVNLTEEGVDAALRLGDLPDSSLVATRVGAAQRVFAASPDYIKARGSLERPADLKRHDCIGVQGFTGPSFWALDDVSDAPSRFRLILNSTDAACEAAKADLGIISVFSHHVATYFGEGTLVPVLSKYERPPQPLSLVRVSGGYQPLKLRAFLDFITPRLKSRLQNAHSDFLATLSRFGEV
jgi:DNA-binding transcriptional LysR family regulator